MTTNKPTAEHEKMMLARLSEAVEKRDAYQKAEGMDMSQFIQSVVGIWYEHSPTGEIFDIHLFLTFLNGYFGEILVRAEIQPIVNGVPHGKAEYEISRVTPKKKKKFKVTKQNEAQIMDEMVNIISESWNSEWIARKWPTS